MKFVRPVVRLVWTAIAILLISAAFFRSPARSEIRIMNDPGGVIYQHMEVFARIRNSGERVVIDGSCFSACTVAVGIIPKNNLCVTNRAVLGFHAAWVDDGNGRPIRSEEGTQAMWDSYTPEIRRWIESRGGLTRKLLRLQGRELQAMVPLCK